MAWLLRDLAQGEGEVALPDTDGGEALPACQLAHQVEHRLVPGRVVVGAEAGGENFIDRRTVPFEITEPVARYGSDVVVVWDAENPASDAYLIAALSVAKAISAQDTGVSNGPEVDVQGLEKAIREVERQARGLDEITRSAQAIDSGGTASGSGSIGWGPGLSPVCGGT